MKMEDPVCEMVNVHYRKMTNGFVFGGKRIAQETVGVAKGDGAQRLAGAEAGQDDGDGASEDFQVEPEGPVVDVLEVELHPLIEADLVAATDLPDAGQTRFHGKAAAMPWVVVLHLGRDGRPGSDEAHVADENIPELRKLVDAGAAQEMPERSDARVVLHL